MNSARRTGSLAAQTRTTTAAASPSALSFGDFAITSVALSCLTEHFGRAVDCRRHGLLRGRGDEEGALPLTRRIFLPPHLAHPASTRIQNAHRITRAARCRHLAANAVTLYKDTKDTKLGITFFRRDPQDGAQPGSAIISRIGATDRPACSTSASVSRPCRACRSTGRCTRAAAARVGGLHEDRQAPEARRL